MNNLYIIGNGFDLAHGVNTCYWNFRTFLEREHWEFLLRFEALYGIQPLDDTEYGYTKEAQKRWNARVNKNLWSEFERFMAQPDIQSMLDLSSSVVADLDLESGNYGIRDTMDVYWRNEFGFIRELQQYVKEWIEQVDLGEVTPRKQALIDNDSDYFLNFNYTRVLEDIYHADQVLHIHGTVGADANYDPIMGHCNSQEIETRRQLSRDSDEHYNEGEASIQEAVANYLSEIYKDTEYYMGINRYFFDRLNVTKEVIIIGWSAGDVDIPYLQRIKNSVSKDAHWTVYYYDQKAYTDLQKVFLECGILNNYKVDFQQSNSFWDT